MAVSLIIASDYHSELPAAHAKSGTLIDHSSFVFRPRTGLRDPKKMNTVNGGNGALSRVFG